MILSNHPRLRFALKVLLAATFPLWVFPVVVVAFFGMLFCMFWDAAESIVEPQPRGSSRRGRYPL